MTINENDTLSYSPGNTPIKEYPDDYIVGSKGYWFSLSSRLDAGKKLFYYDAVIGEGPVNNTILFVHGNPESSYTYRNIVRELENGVDEATRVIAMDHIGFGLSDQADYEMVDMHHAENVAELVRYLDLQEITLVVHDWGGAIGIGALINCPERVKNLVLMNTTVFPVPKTGRTYKSFPFPYPFGWNTLGHHCPPNLWRHIPPIVMLSGVGRLNLIKRILSYTFRTCVGQLSSTEKLYKTMFSTQKNALNSMRNVKQTYDWGHGYQYVDTVHGKQCNKVFYENIQRLINCVWGPYGANIGVKAFFGNWDVLAKNEVQQQWLAALPQLSGNIETFDDAGHFVEEHKFKEIARGIIALLNR